MISTYGGGEPTTPAAALDAIGAALGVASDAAGNVYFASADLNSVFKVDPSGVLTRVAGNSRPGYSGDRGLATSARLRLDYQSSKVVLGDVAVYNGGNLFIADTGNGCIRKVSPSGIITTVAGNGRVGYSGDGGPATNALLSSPIGLALDVSGNLFFVDAGNYRVRKISSSGTITTVAGTGRGGFSGDGGPATNAALSDFSTCNSYCGGVAMDRAGNLFIADPENNRVRKVSPDGIITTVAGGGNAGRGDCGSATDAQLGYPIAVAVDRSGNLFMGEDRRVRRVSTNGIITTVAGIGQTGEYTGDPADGGPATSAQLSWPASLAVDEAGNLFIADPGWRFFTGIDFAYAPDRIRKVSPNGTITTIAGTGVGGFSGDEGAAIGARLNGPTGIALDGAGNIYVTDTNNGVVRLLRATDRSVLIGAVVDAASQRADPVSPGKIVVIYGAGLGPSQVVQNRASNAQFGTELAGTVVSFNGIAAPLLYTSATQVAAAVPYMVRGTSAQMTMTYQSEVSNTITIPVAVSAPSLFTLNQAGSGQAAAIDALDGSANMAANPVKLGGYVSLYATGEGETGSTTPPRPLLPVSVTVGGIPATVQYAGGAPGQVAGLMQVNVQIPGGVQPGGYVPVVLQVGDRSSSPAVWIAVAN